MLDFTFLLKYIFDQMRILILILLFPAYSTFSQIVEPRDPTIFYDEDLGRMDITIQQEYLDAIFDNPLSDDEYPANFAYQSAVRSDFETNIGFRIRGNTSRYSAKKSFKVSFNSFEKGRDLEGFEKLNINGEHNDPTMIRAKLCWDMMNAIGVRAPRANHVKLYINEDYMGLYTNVEHIDEEFVEERFGNKDGNLYKCLYPADLKYLGADPELYKFESGGRRAYELKINEEEDDYTGLANFIKILNTTADTQFETAIQKVFHVNSYLKALAVETLVAHWDNYGINQNNYYLYENPEDELIYYIPYDLDNTLGVDFFDVDWADYPIYEWYRDDRPLTKRIMEVEAFREEYTRILDDLLRNHFSPGQLFSKIDQIKSMIQEAAEQDEYRTYDYGFTIDDFNRSFTERLDDFHVRYGLKPYIERRHETARDQLEEVVLLHLEVKDPQVTIYPNPTSDYLKIETDKNISGVSLVNHAGKNLGRLKADKESYLLPQNLSPGLYYLLVSFSDGSNTTGKLKLK